MRGGSLRGGWARAAPVGLIAALLAPGVAHGEMVLVPYGPIHYFGEILSGEMDGVPCAIHPLVPGETISHLASARDCEVKDYGGPQAEKNFRVELINLGDGADVLTLIVLDETSWPAFLEADAAGNGGTASFTAFQANGPPEVWVHGTSVNSVAPYRLQFYPP